MLITFSCKAHENVTMFGEVALALLKWMGHSGAVPGAILAADVPDALEKLQNLAKQPTEQPLANEDQEPSVSLNHRAIPLIALLKNAVKQHCNVTWDKN